MALTHFWGRPQNILMSCEGEQKERYLYPAIKGERMDALAMTEPDAGSDVRSTKTFAKKMAVTGSLMAPSTSYLASSHGFCYCIYCYRRR